MKICTVEGCEKVVKAKGLCDMHLQRTYRYGSIGGSERIRGRVSKSEMTFSKEFVNKKCNIAGCEENGIGMGFCEKHYKEFGLERKGKGFR